MASTERTPLTQRPPGPSYIFPGVSPRSRRRQARQFQCCMCFIFSSVSLILASAVVVAILYTSSERARLGNETDIGGELAISLEPGPLNDTELTTLILWEENPLTDESVAEWKLPNPLMAMLIESERHARKQLGDREIMEENVNLVPLNSPSYKHQRAVGTSPEARMFAKRGYVETEATRYMARKFNYTKPFGRSSIGEGPEIVLLNKQPMVDCDKFRRYRSANGTCNNRKHPRKWGVAMNPFRRMLLPDYADGMSSPRESHYNHSLPTAREVSLKVHRPSYSTDHNFTVMLAVWGQFLDHDITATALTQGADGEPIDCCVADEQRHPECFVVPLGHGDPYFDKKNITCMNFLRSAAAPTGNYGPRQQLNQATSFIDGSVVYGNTEQRQKELRTMEGGKLRMFVTPDNRTLLPISMNAHDGCNEAEMNAQGKYCFDSGDARANENLHLTSMHLLMARHHNYLASNLQAMNPHWEDEKIFQEARKILGAQMQHITYNEFIPIVLGDEIVGHKKLLPKSSEDGGDLYREHVDASAANGFAASAFRFAHTLLPSLMRAARNDSSEDSILLHKMLFNPYSLWLQDGIDDALRSAVNTPMAKSDQFFTTELTQKLFEGSPASKPAKASYPPGLDLVSLNLQRGRDHGLPAYYEWRKHCKLPPADSWKGMEYSFNNVSLTNVKSIYKHPKDVDFYCGALSEPPLHGAIVGPLLACVISDQFWRIKHGDSHWYERTTGPQRFTDDQLKEIYKTTLARLMCINSDNIEDVQEFVMRRIDPESNPLVQCSDIDDFDFTPWKSSSNVARVSTAHISSEVRIMNKNESLNENTTRKTLD